MFSCITPAVRPTIVINFEIKTHQFIRNLKAIAIRILLTYNLVLSLLYSYADVIHAMRRRVLHVRTNGSILSFVNVFI